MYRQRILFALLLGLSLVLTGCSGGKELTAGQIEAVNAAFEPVVPAEEGDIAAGQGPEGAFTVNPITHFFTSCYETPEELDLGKFVAYIPSDSPLSPGDEDELDALRAAGFPVSFDRVEDAPVVIKRVPFSTVDAYLQRYAGVSLSAMENPGDAWYLEDYGCFYSLASDFNPGSFACTRGVQRGDNLVLYSADAVLTLARSGDTWQIISHLPAEDPE